MKPSHTLLTALLAAEELALDNMSRFTREIRPATIDACVNRGWLRYFPNAQNRYGQWKLTKEGKAVLDQWLPEEKANPSVSACPVCGNTAAGYYAPFCSRRHMYKGRKDHRHTQETIDLIREERQRTQSMFRHVKPGRQRL